FHRIREYRPGDEPRSIHWRTTARRNELMVREFRESRDRHLIVLLDAWIPERTGASDLERVEYAISLATTIALTQMLSGRGSDVFFAMSGSELRSWGGSKGDGERNNLLDSLALLQPSPRANVSRLLQAALQEQTPHSRTILVTPDHDRARALNLPSLESSGGRAAPAWSDLPQVVTADPAAIGQLFTLDSAAPAPAQPTTRAAGAAGSGVADPEPLRLPASPAVPEPAGGPGT